MSREERRQYQRQMRSMEKGPALPPAARARAERNAARRQMRRGTGEPGASSARRFWIRAAVIAVALGFLAFSLQWPNMPFAAYVGLGVTAVVGLLIVGFRFLQRRVASRS